MLKYKNLLLVVSGLAAIMVVFEQCISKDEKNDAAARTGPGYAQFAGSASCAPCHQQLFEAHQHTAHHLTSAGANEKNILGDFSVGKNVFSFALNASVQMEKRKDSFYQVHYLDGIQKMARKFDIVVGSGTKGQTYLNWYNDRLMQLPITWFAATGQWCNSPGYPGKIVFNRPITSRCMECHSTFAEVTSAAGKEPETFNKATMIYGVECERCHRAGADHVAYQTQHPDERTAKYIVNTGKLSRQQNLDLCILCHGGRMQKQQPSFSFVAGGYLGNYFSRDTMNQLVSDIDVHGNQYGLMAASKCFIKSNTMTCNSCHNAHAKDAGELELYSQKCLSCHHAEHVADCKMTRTIGATIQANCIDCHMPQEQSKAIVVMLQGSDVPTPAKLRSHYIKHYPEATKQYLEQLKLSVKK